MKSRIAILLAGAAAGAVLLSGVAPRPETDGSLALPDATEIAASACRQDRPGARNPLAALASLSLARAASAATSPFPPLFDELGNRSFPVTGASPQAQRFVDQGLAWVYGFNHAAAVQSFRAAQQLSPECAMCFWGEALALGPNINMPMTDPAVNPAVRAIREAERLAPGASPRDRALIVALALRYGSGERAVLDRAYADAMRGVAQQFPDDHDVAVLFADSMMNLQPWDYWEADRRTPKGGAGEAIAAVERVLAADPEHAGAIHLYIHLMEASAEVAKAEPYADRLGPLVPGAGHLVHMPSHIYYRVGRYQDSIAANAAAVQADEAYLARAEASSIYASGYYPHNLHFLLTSAQMAGRSKEALAAAYRLDSLIDPEVARNIAWIQVIKAAPYFALAQFGSPQEILGLPDPGNEFPLVRAMWHYARGVGFALEGQPAAAAGEAEAMAAISQEQDFSGLTAGGVPAPHMLQIALHVLRGRIAQAEARPEDAVTEFRAAAGIQDGLAYMEPPYWYYPVRQSLGAALLDAGRPAEAADEFMASLVQAPNNGWALFGLMRAQEAMGDPTAAKVTGAALARAWGGDASPDLARL